MQKQLIAISPNDLNKYWPEIRAEVSTVETPDGFIPEDVYAMCKSNAATLFFLMADGQRVGWMVLRQLGTDMHIWQLKADSGYDVMRLFRAELMALARGANCNKITYGSTRKAWAKVSAEHGFSMRMIVYECPVDQAPQIPSTEEHPDAQHPGN